MRGQSAQFDLGGSGVALLLAELDHRIRNLLTTIEAAVKQTRSTTVEDCRAKLIARITGLYSFCEFTRPYGRRLGLAQLLRCRREIERHQNADKSYKNEGVALLDLARNVHRLFAMQEPREKRRLLNFVLSNCTWENGEVVATFRQPFDMLAETTTAAERLGADERTKSAKSEIWLGRQDSNLSIPSFIH
jgi:HWE histidine kinase